MAIDEKSEKRFNRWLDSIVFVDRAGQVIEPELAADESDDPEGDREGEVTTPMFRIRCFVTGGVTGSREAWLKAKDGSIYETTAFMEAKRLADKYNKEMNAIGKRAKFDYRVVVFNSMLGAPQSENNN
jgi:hypothetical protein